MTNTHRDLPTEFVIARALEPILAEYLHSIVDPDEIAESILRVFPGAGIDRVEAERIALAFTELLDVTEVDDMHTVLEVNVVVNDLPDSVVHA